MINIYFFSLFFFYLNNVGTYMSYDYKVFTYLYKMSFMWILEKTVGINIGNFERN